MRRAHSDTRPEYRYPDGMEQERVARRPRTAGVVGLIVGVLFLGLAAAAFFAGGGPIVAAIAAAGGLLTLAAGIVLLVRP